ncbi:MAG: hypothetical protein EAY75_17255 [Bacteroidetes bacterium]|nr:MAG: hypothetical protein EAY75_17255 [Bacteroidota bacterium]
MDNFLDDLKSSWKAHKAQTAPVVDVKALLSKAEVYKKNSIRFQHGNVMVLSVTLILYCTFFYKFLLYGTRLSQSGFIMMAVPLFIRIVAEMISIAKGRNIKLDENAFHHNQQMTQYTAFRKWMHGPATYTIMGFYTLGYYFIMVQFSELVSRWLIILMCVAYPLVAYIIIKQVRRGIKNEMEQLQWMSKWNKEMIEE